ncbi:hypothetical protein BW247_11650 [Acidihalobacter ferrooxydans]|uniref:TonB C-terminal domain-containing protein n=2 Tax=Acidihalobacter ferrooxydans TaxID=1765967 RepID=A0A1P8UIR5_9GAMM|nr:hypothetical protein BW247_11650 [Acidihalobacter ferrooxydans]
MASLNSRLCRSHWLATVIILSLATVPLSAAASWYRKAAEQGYAPAEYELGSLYEKGLGVPQNYMTAASWYRKAANQRYAPAENNLGSLYEKGLGVPQSYTKAIYWYRKAAEQSNAPAENNLGILYASGHGVPQDFVTAAKWLILAKASMSSTDPSRLPAIENALSTVEEEMTPAQIAKAQRQASAWWSAHHHSATPQPTHSTTPQPTHSTTPQPSHSTTPQPTHSATPQPTHSATPQPTHSTTPQPTHSTTPQPTHSTTPQSRRDAALQARWAAQIKNKIQSHWSIPPGYQPGESCQVTVTQDRSGYILSVRIGHCSGGELFRRSLEMATSESSPLPPAPSPQVFQSKLILEFNPG